MLRLVVLSCLAVLAYSEDPCCAPMKWNGVQSMVIASMPNGGVAPAVTRASYMVNVDSERHMLSLTGTSETNGVVSNVKVLTDYAKGVQYLVTNGTCSKSVSGQDPGHCVPANSTVSGHGFLGVGANAANVTQYTFSIDGMTAYLTVTDKCVPVAETYYGITNGTYSFSSIAFTGIKGGIADDTVFNLPSECALGTGTINGGFNFGRRSHFA
ncbi:development-specific protein LVN1.2-like [Ylistrum balloti]|uniref:development-specific protein LVN1.2-like n=1 Tax=Ylistrum balloti TaxID=509963 RepID=UPI0029058611|nr:development-specific protein LVN1.2-like [Ylistrum balloti]